MVKKLIIFIIILTFMTTAASFSETDPCNQETNTVITNETLMDRLMVTIINGKVAALPGTEGLKEDEIKIGDAIYQLNPEDLESHKAFKPGDDVKLYYRQQDNGKKALMLQVKPEATEADAFKLLKALDIISALEDEGPSIEDTLSRAQFMVLAVRILGYEDSAYLSYDIDEKSRYRISDDILDHWAYGYFAVGKSLGIIKGYPDGTYGPDENITYEQAVTIITRMLGYERKALDCGGYPGGYMHVSKELGITGNAEQTIDKPVTWGSAAYLLFNSLPVNIMQLLGEKPVIYLYPEKEQDISVKLNLKGELTFTYPGYNNGWNVKARHDGTIINSEDGMEYPYLFWEGIIHMPGLSLDKGFVVRGENTIKFLQDTLALMGLIPEERDEFIAYWAPRMQENKYNLITFAGKEYEEAAPLEIEPAPDSILRIFMVYKPLEEPIEVEPPEIKSFDRNGFTVVEWGGAEVN